MEKIENFNCDGLCDEIHCGSKPTQFQYIKINNMEIIITLCDKHAEQWDNNYWSKDD